MTDVTEKPKLPDWAIEEQRRVWTSSWLNALADAFMKLRRETLEECAKAARCEFRDDGTAQRVEARIRAYLDSPTLRDGCQECHGMNGGVPGNENMVDGKAICDYCHAHK